MKNHLKLMATCVLVSAMAAAQAQTATASGDATGKSTVPHRAARKATPKRPSVETEIQQLREDMESQINQLKQQLNDSNAQLQAAQQQAAAANAAAAIHRVIKFPRPILPPLKSPYSALHLELLLLTSSYLLASYGFATTSFCTSRSSSKSKSEYRS